MFNKDHNNAIVDVIQNILDNMSSKVQQLPDGSCIYKSFIDTLEIPVVIKQNPETLGFEYKMYYGEELIASTNDMFVLAVCYISYIKEKEMDIE